MYTQSRRNRNAVNVWPGFVDALASVLLVFIFMLLIFVVGQFFLTDILIGRNKELYQLNQEVDVLSGDLVMEQHRTATQSKRIGELDASLRATMQERDRLNRELQLKLREIASLQEDISALRTFRQELESKVADMVLALEQRGVDLTQAAEQAARDRSLISSRGEDIAQLEALRDKLRSEVAELSTTLTLNREEMMAVRDRSKALALKLSDQEERTRLAQVSIDSKDIRLQELRELLTNVDQALADEKKLSAQKHKQLELNLARLAQMDEELKRYLQQLAQRDDKLKQKDKQLAKQGSELDTKDQQLVLKWKQLARNKSASSMQREEIEQLRSELKLSSTQVGEQQEELDRLNTELNRELASKVKELSRYRSEFFGRLRDVLGDHPDIRVVGDRFLFQSELLFASGSAELGDQGRVQLKKLAATLKTVSARIPGDINWILRVDGHTDRIPINTEQFPSNWELSTARALSIVNFLVAEGIQPGRLAATGFAEFHPLDRKQTREAFSRNRRIELKLTER